MFLYPLRLATIALNIRLIFDETLKNPEESNSMKLIISRISHSAYLIKSNVII